MHFDIVQELSYSGPLTIRVNGACMGANLPHGSDVTIIRKAIYWPGDIVVIGRADDQMYSHRFLGYLPGKRGWKAVTIADSEIQPDPTVRAKRILGKVLSINGGTTVMTSRQRLRSIFTYLRVVPRIIHSHFASHR
jgi:hypothetical protein